MNRHRLSVAVVSGSGSTRPYAARWNKAAARLNDTQLAADSAGISGDNRWMNPVFKQTRPLRGSTFQPWYLRREQWRSATRP